MRRAPVAKPDAYHPDHTRAASAGLHAALAAPCTKMITTGDDTMQLKRNMMTLALISAGIGFATCANVAFAASAPMRGAQDQTQQDQTPTTDQNATDKKKNEKKKQQPQQLQTINVRGYAGSLQNATAIKRNSDEIVELPGTSIADALGRLPGLAVQTLSGRPQVLTIHGLGPDFSTALVNGRE